MVSLAQPISLDSTESSLVSGTKHESGQEEEGWKVEIAHIMRKHEGFGVKPDRAGFWAFVGLWARLSLRTLALAKPLAILATT
jgi:hypothetical protein